MGVGKIDDHRPLQPDRQDLEGDLPPPAPRPARQQGDESRGRGVQEEPRQKIHERKVNHGT